MQRLSSMLPAIMSLAAVFILVNLGNWQIERLAWKEDLLALIAARQAASPVLLNEISNFSTLTKADYDYQRVHVRGKFDHTQAQFWFTQIINPPMGFPAQLGIGHHVITPLHLEDGRIVLVDRGFLPMDATAEDPHGLITLGAILRWPAQRRYFDNADQPEKNLWYVRDVKKISAHIGIADTGFLLEARAMDGAAIPPFRFPLGGQTRFDFPNKHLGYALTWYGLALAAVIICGLWYRRKFRYKT